jgi:hypothetical protein
MIGMFYINGPFFFKPNTSNILLNDFNWNKEANLLYIESPQGVPPPLFRSDSALGQMMSSSMMLLLLTII